MDVIMVYNGVIMGIKDTLFTFITFVIMVYNGVIMESQFADGALLGVTFKEVGCRGPSCWPAFSSQASQALMRRGARLQAQISLPARLPGQAHRPRYPEGPAAPRT